MDSDLRWCRQWWLVMENHSIIKWRVFIVKCSWTSRDKLAHIKAKHHKYKWRKRPRTARAELMLLDRLTESLYASTAHADACKWMQTQSAKSKSRHIFPKCHSKMLHVVITVLLFKRHNLWKAKINPKSSPTPKNRLVVSQSEAGDYPHACTNTHTQLHLVGADKENFVLPSGNPAKKKKERKRRGLRGWQTGGGEGMGGGDCSKLRHVPLLPTPTLTNTISAAIRRGRGVLGFTGWFMEMAANQ